MANTTTEYVSVSTVSRSAPCGRESANETGIVPLMQSVDGTAVPAAEHVVAMQMCDQHGNPVADLPVQWSSPAASAKIDPLRSVSDAEGRVQTQWTIDWARNRQPTLGAVLADGSTRKVITLNGSTTARNPTTPPRRL